MSITFLDYIQNCKKKKKKLKCKSSIFQGWDRSLVDTASDQYAAEARSITRCRKGFFSQSQLSVQTQLHMSIHPCVQSHAHLCAH